MYKYKVGDLVGAVENTHDWYREPRRIGIVKSLEKDLAVVYWFKNKVSEAFINSNFSKYIEKISK